MTLSIKQKIENLEIKKEEIEIFAQQMIKICNESIRNLRSQCLHGSVKYVPDASGNNDSYYYCTDCGEEKKDFTY